MQNKSKSSPKESSTVEMYKRIWGILPSLAAFLIFIAILISGYSCHQKHIQLEALKKEQMKKNKPNVNVVVLPLQPETIRDRINFPGITQPWVRLDVLCEISGKVLTKEKSEGQTVEKGEVIARIDDRDYVNALNSARAAYNLADVSLTRLKGLYKAQLSTEAELDNAVANLAHTRAALDSAALNVERCTIKSPLSGTLNRIYIEEGQYLSNSVKVAEILQLDRIKVKVGIPESDVDAVRKIENFEISIDALNKKKFIAKKHFLSKTADDTARLYDLELMVSNPEQEILPDMFARIEIVKQVLTDAVAVPISAIISIDKTHKMYIANGSKAHEREVVLGLREGILVQITSGLNFGEKVIIEGQRSVSDGQPVKIVRQVNKIEELL